MASDSAKIGLGLVAGVVLVVAVLVLIRMHQQQTQQGQLTTYNVVRDDQGRIQSVDTLSGLPLEGGQQRPAPQRQVGPAAAPQDEAAAMRN